MPADITLFSMGCYTEAMMADVAKQDVAKQIEEHLQRRCNGASSEPSFANCLTISDKFEAHGMGVLIEELMSRVELAELRRRVR